MPLPFELRAVEMALKDSEGRNIAEKIDELDTDVDSIVGFDGELNLIIVAGTVTSYLLSQESIDYIKSSTAKRLVKTNIGAKSAYLDYSGNNYYLRVLTLMNTTIILEIFTIPHDIQPNTALEHTYISSDSKLYMHNVVVEDSDLNQHNLSVISYRPIAFQRVSDLISYNLHSYTLIPAFDDFNAPLYFTRKDMSGYIYAYYMVGTTPTYLTDAYIDGIISDTVTPL